MSEIYSDKIEVYYIIALLSIISSVSCIVIIIFSMIISIIQLIKGSLCKIINHLLLFLLGIVMVIIIISFIGLFFTSFGFLKGYDIILTEQERGIIETKQSCCFEVYSENKHMIYSDNCKCQYFIPDQNILDSKCSQCMTIVEYEKSSKTLMVLGDIFILFNIFYLILYCALFFLLTIPYFNKWIKKHTKFEHF
ncbi:hypothetical protein KM1_129410 [Entamoeba histolytica HM-3:IMSS]|nr:Hypothetical protein EHI5A_108650 [Entamoeba histolytica KU27]EMS17978.1 hypothetical protein KM1_129410 [Entamoeba histolytica HM-3:IMSS]